MGSVLTTLTTRYIVADVFDALRTLPDQSVDLVMTSPPFLALRSYLPADHPDKSKEIGSEATPADFIDTMLDVAEECRRVLAPHGSLVYELGDTYSGSGGAGGDYNEDGFREGQTKFSGSAAKRRKLGIGDDYRPARSGRDNGWPLDKSLTGIPTLFAWSLAYGRNLLRPERPTDQWRIRNVIVWARPNPPVGALADKCRPATSYLTVATMARDRWFDMDAMRVPVEDPWRTIARPNMMRQRPRGFDEDQGAVSNPAGAPLLDYWEIATQPYKGSHYATYPEELARRVILLMCPERVCMECGEPSRRITGEVLYTDAQGDDRNSDARSWASAGPNGNRGKNQGRTDGGVIRTAPTLGWTDCGHNAWRPGVVLDPFAGSGTTLRMAQGNGRSSIGIDLDSRNAGLAIERVGPLYLTVETLAGAA